MTFDIIVWFYATFEKPQFNWYQKNDTYFTDIQKWRYGKIHTSKSFVKFI